MDRAQGIANALRHGTTASGSRRYLAHRSRLGSRRGTTWPDARRGASWQKRPLHVWFKTQSKTLLLAMKIRPFLSHKREDAPEIAKLKSTLQIYGAGGWRDTEDLRLGTQTPSELRRAINSETGGFLWWGTRSALKSEVITTIEIPAALDRAAAGDYPLVPVFVELDPISDRGAFESTLTRADDFLGFNGVVRRHSETARAFRRRIARRYVSDAISGLPRRRCSVAFRALSAPDDRADATCDWRSIFDAHSRVFVRGGLEQAKDAVRNLRESFQRREQTPEIEVDSDLPLPLAFLAGYEWRETTRLRLQVRQRTGTSYALISGEGEAQNRVTPQVEHLGGRGPAVLVVSCGNGMDLAAHRYAACVDAQELRMLHVQGVLDAPSVRGLARTAAAELQGLRERAVDKHLLILGPGALAILTGAAANAVGPVTVPFWRNASMAYGGTVVIGDDGD
jgi:hypothetical protein